MLYVCYGFTKGRSYTDAGIRLIQSICAAWVGSQDAHGMFCDLSKEFDWVQVSTLVVKVRPLRHNRACTQSSDLSFSRVQRVVVNGKKSPGSLVSIAIPPGSILGSFPKDSLRQKLKEINILTVASQYIFQNLMNVKKNINDFTKIGDVRNINTRNRSKLIAPVTQITLSPLFVYGTMCTLLQ